MILKKTLEWIFEAFEETEKYYGGFLFSLFALLFLGKIDASIAIMMAGVFVILHLAIFGLYKAWHSFKNKK
jgi:hypothetical protein